MTNRSRTVTKNVTKTGANADVHIAPIILTGAYFISDFLLSRPHRIGEVSSDLMRELDYNTDLLMQQIAEAHPLLNSEQN